MVVDEYFEFLLKFLPLMKALRTISTKIIIYFGQLFHLDGNRRKNALEMDQKFNQVCPSVDGHLRIIVVAPMTDLRMFIIQKIENVAQMEKWYEITRIVRRFMPVPRYKLRSFLIFFHIFFVFFSYFFIFFSYFFHIFFIFFHIFSYFFIFFHIFHIFLNIVPIFIYIFSCRNLREIFVYTYIINIYICKSYLSYI